MKNLIKKIIWWLVSPILPLLILSSCLNQKKNVENSVKENSTQKNEVISDKSENKSEQETTQNSSVKISDSTIIFNSKSELLEYIKKNYSQKLETENSGKSSAKTTEQEEYFENGNLKSKIKTSENTTEYINSLKSAYQEMQEKYNKASDNSEKLLKVSKNFENLYKETRIENYSLSAKNSIQNFTIKNLEKENKKLIENTPVTFWQKFLFAWKYIVFAFFLGWFVMPFVWRWFRSWLLRFNPYLKFLEKINQKFKNDKFNSL